MNKTRNTADSLPLSCTKIHAGISRDRILGSGNSQNARLAVYAAFGNAAALLALNAG
jgi:hypothetical protein